MRQVEPAIGFVCEAFAPIPVDVLASVKDHREPIDGDHGLRFLPKSEDSWDEASVMKRFYDNP